MGLHIDRACTGYDRRRRDSDGLDGKTVEGIGCREEFEAAEEVDRLTSKKGDHC